MVAYVYNLQINAYIYWLDCMKFAFTDGRVRFICGCDGEAREEFWR